MTELKVGDTVRIITPTAVFSYVADINDTITTRKSDSRKDGMVGAKAKVVHISNGNFPLVKVRVSANKFYTAQFTGWEFRKVHVINLALSKLKSN